MNLIATPTATSFSVEVPEDKFRALIHAQLFEDDLMHDLMRAGAYNVDWSGHYGAQILFTLNVEDDVAPIVKIIADAMEELP